MCGRTDMGLLLYELFFIVKSLQYVMIGLGSNGCFVIGAPCFNRGHGYGFASNMGHPRSESVRLLVYDGMRTYPGHQCCITGPLRQRQPCREGVNILGRPYETNNDIYVYKIHFFMIFPALNSRYCHWNYASVNISKQTPTF
jgi:hypothetical protein